MKKLFVETCGWPLLLICSIVGMSGCGDVDQSAELDRFMRSHLNIPSVQQVDPATIQSAILNNLPRGSSAVQVHTFLKKCSIGKVDSYTISGEDMIICQINYPVSKFMMVSIVVKTYSIEFVMGADHVLKDVRVKEWLTGP